jgi:SAM-dependent methyltransferase
VIDLDRSVVVEREITMTNYTTQFYDIIRDGSRRSAEVMAPIVVRLIQPRSIVDVGCGDGTWLSVFAKMGCVDILGIDGDYVDRHSLQIPNEQFRAANLSRALTVSRTFDLAMSLEVAEHLPPKSAEGFIAGLTKLAPVVLFSAAIPFQGGTDHVNEQWPQYWANLFEKHGFDAIDCIRSEIWDNGGVEWWYAQNTILYANEAGLKAHPNLRKSSSSVGLSVVHPRQYLHLVEGLPPPPGLRKSLSLTVAATKRALLKRLAPSRAANL